MVKTCITATCFIVIDGKMLFLKHKKLDKWLPPGGHVENNETPLEAIHREVMEEVGLKVRIIDTYRIGSNKKYMVDGDLAQEVVSPMITLLANLPYKTGTHRHFDLNYLATADGLALKQTTEEHEVGLFGKEELENINTTQNVREISYMSLDFYKRFKGPD